MTRTGKIARLPRQIRDLLNTRMDDGEPSKDLVQWLNGLDATKEILAGDFAGRPISEQNLSEWKQGGFRDWQRQQHTSECMRLLVEQSDELSDSAQENSIPERLALILAAELAAQTQTLLGETTDSKERWNILRQALRQLHLLRRDNDQAEHTRKQLESWEIECAQREKQEAEAARQKTLDRVLAPLKAGQYRQTLVGYYGGGKAGEDAADFRIEMEEQYAEPLSCIPSAGRVSSSSPPSSGPKSGSIKPNQTKSD